MKRIDDRRSPSIFLALTLLGAVFAGGCADQASRGGDDGPQAIRETGYLACVDGGEECPGELSCTTDEGGRECVEVPEACDAAVDCACAGATVCGQHACEDQNNGIACQGVGAADGRGAEEEEGNTPSDDGGEEVGESEASEGGEADGGSEAVGEGEGEGEGEEGEGEEGEGEEGEGEGEGGVVVPDCFELWEDPDVVSLAVARPDPDGFAGLRLDFRYEVTERGNARVVFERASGGGVARPSGDPLSPETHSGSWVELRNADDETLYTRVVNQLVPEGVEVHGPDGPSWVPGCPEDGFIRVSDLANDPEATQVVFFQEAVDGETTGVTVEFARWDLPAIGCHPGKLRTSGMAQRLGPGAQCDLLVVCTDQPLDEAFRAAVEAGFDDVECHEGRDCVEHMDQEVCSCGPQDVAFCRSWIQQVDDDEYAAACALGARDDVTGLVCAGDL